MYIFINIHDNDLHNKISSALPQYFYFLLALLYLISNYAVPLALHTRYSHLQLDTCYPCILPQLLISFRGFSSIYKNRLDIVSRWSNHTQFFFILEFIKLCLNYLVHHVIGIYLNFTRLATIQNREPVKAKCLSLYCTWVKNRSCYIIKV